MTITTDETTKWLVGAFFAISMALSGVVYAAVNTRITDLETDRKVSVLMLADLKEKLALLQRDANQLQGAVTSIQEIQFLSSKKLDMLLVSSQRASQWRDVVDERSKADSTRWNNAMDSQPQPGKKK